MRWQCFFALILCTCLCFAQGPPFTKDQILHLIGSVQMLEEEQITVSNMFLRSPCRPSARETAPLRPSKVVC